MLKIQHLKLKIFHSGEFGDKIEFLCNSCRCGHVASYRGSTASSSMHGVNDDPSSTGSSLQLTVVLVGSSVTATHWAPVVGVDARPVTGVADGSLTGCVQETALTGTATQLTARQTAYTATTHRPKHPFKFFAIF